MKVAPKIKGQGEISLNLTQMLLHLWLTKIRRSADDGTSKRLLTDDSCKAEITQLDLKCSCT